MEEINYKTCVKHKYQTLPDFLQQLLYQLFSETQF